MPRRTHTPAVGNWYRSRDEKFLMRIVRIESDRVHCRFVQKHGGRAFTLPLSFFRSPACGWRRTVDAERAAGHP